MKLEVSILIRLKVPSMNQWCENYFSRGGAKHKNLITIIIIHIYIFVINNRNPFLIFYSFNVDIGTI